MPDFTCRPTADGTIQWQTTFGSGSSNWGRMAIESDSEGIANTTPGGTLYNSYAVTDIPKYAIGVANVQGHMRVRKDTGQNCTYSLDIYDGVSQTIEGTHQAPSFNTWTSYDESYTHPTAWTIPMINAMALKMYGNAFTDTKLGNAAWVKAVVTYYPATGGYSMMIYDWLAPIIGLVGGAVDVVRELSFLSLLDHRPSSRKDWDLIKEEIRQWPRCRPVILGHPSPLA